MTICSFCNCEVSSLYNFETVLEEIICAKCLVNYVAENHLTKKEIIRLDRVEIIKIVEKKLKNKKVKKELQIKEECFSDFENFVVNAAKIRRGGFGF